MTKLHRPTTGEGRAAQQWWSADDHIASLIHLREEGLSTRLIAVEIGTTKNAVVGKLNRMGMLNNAPVPTLGERLGALHAALDRVLEETR